MNPSNGGIPPQNSPPGRPPDPSLSAVEERVHPPLIGEPILGAALPRFEANEGEKSAGTSASTPILVTESLDATWKPGEVEKGVQSLCRDGPGEEGKPCQAMNSDLQTAMDCTGGKSPSMHQDQFQAVQSVWNSPLSVGNDEGGKQKCADPAAGQLRAAPAANQFRTAPAADHVSNTQNAGPGTVPGPSPNKPMNVSTGFNYARTVQGDIPKSIKFNKLVESHGDLYPQDQGLVDGMDVDKSRLKCRNTEVCQLNREHEVRSRILPESITSPPKLGERSSSLLLGPGCSGKNYGISDDQKKNIATRLNNEGSISVDIVDQWCPGQWDYFNDLCTLMGLDPDYCIEDVESDDENGTAQFFAAQMKVGLDPDYCIEDVFCFWGCYAHCKNPFLERSAGPSE
ncbi:hypothetical protein L1987_19168 [Smallanthus sonchifolius]|uniref:Uncharacterized protein n=1 Tax=Smallanthus sonchifolius TaxID=185202 RepID=A0ACB9J405_9ASTR|nr:hypothetical protein L1987_19168 [Smallanthus sonchifolius]